MSVVAIVAELSATFKYGDAIQKEWFHDRLAYDPLSDSNREALRYARSMELIHEALRRDHRQLLVKGVDEYRLPHPHEFARIALRRVQRGMHSAFAEGDQIIAAAPKPEMTAEQRKEITDAEMHIARIKAFVKG